MWKFKVSKYKNAAPRIPKKEEWITDISANNLLNSSGNHIASSTIHVVFNTDASGCGSLAILPLESKGRHHSSTIRHINAHSDYVTDFHFSPFDDCLLATGSQDNTARVWHLPETVDSDISSAECTLTPGERKVENVAWSPSVAAILAVSSGHTIKVYDVCAQNSKYEYAGHGDVVQNFNWKSDGSLLATTCKDLKLRIVDPRTQSVAQETAGHPNVKDTRVMWMGNSSLLLSAGYSKSQERQVCLHDTRQLTSPLTTLSMSSSRGSLMPLFDPDTNMLFLTGKGDTSIRYLELTEKTPYLTEDSVDSVEQVKGVCMLPNRALDVMNGEVNRLLVLSKSAVVPVPYIVPRKSYTEFHDDIFPDTASGEPAMTVEEWCQGCNRQGSKISLNPSKKQVQKVLRRNLQQLNMLGGGDNLPVKSTVKQTEQETETNEPIKADDTTFPTNEVQHSISSQELESTSLKPEVEESKPPISGQVLLREKQQQKVFSGVRQSKFRHLQGVTDHKSQNIENIRNLSKSIPGESDMFQANSKYCAVPLGGPGGCIAIHKTTAPGRLPDTGIPVLQNGSNIADFVFDPFNDSRLVVACDDAKIQVWDIPEGGLTESLSEPTLVLTGHTEKLYLVRFHPMASGVLVSASYDLSVRVWDVDTATQHYKLEGHTDTIFCLDWSSDGKYFVTACKDGSLRVYEPRKSPSPIKTGVGPEGTRGARIKWVCEDKYIIVTGFDRQSKRCVWIYCAEDLSKALYCVDFDNTPAILVPFYDCDSNTLLLTGRGDGVVRSVEVSEEFPHLFPLSDYKTVGLHQGLSFLSKQYVNVKKVEFARAWRLTQNSVEPLGFTVPRIKTDYFQDDIFPDTRVTWEAVMSSADWLSGKNGTQRVVSLKPPDMIKLSEAPTEAPKVRKYEAFHEYKQHYKTDEEKKEELLAAMNTKLDIQKDPLPQDLAEGVDDDEWDD